LAETQLRILMVVRAPWDPRLGASQVQRELAQELRARGHHVDKFSYEEAFPNATRLTYLTQSFAKRAARYLMTASPQYDVVDAQQGTLPYSRRSLGVRGVVARSSGLADFYRRFEKEARNRWPEEFRGSLGGRILRWRKARSDERDASRMLETCDLINVINRDEADYLKDVKGLEGKTVLIPPGLSVETLEQLRTGVAAPSYRLAEQQVGFVGYWDIRKGARDWRRILEGVRRELPQASFRFAGTALPPEVVQGYLGPESDRRVMVVPEFEREELPAMLYSVTVGALPSYIEGFPLAVLEKLAAGIPTVAYDVPGPRDSLGRVDPSLLVPAGDTDAFSRRLVQVLTMDRLEYLELAMRCRAAADRYLWPGLVARTIRAYERALSSGDRAPASPPASER
jgi:glycosyltransferase involved in cell wall biosynthesis